MTRLERARKLAERWSGEWLHTVIRSPCKPTDGPCAWFYPEDLASLTLDGYPAPRTRRKLPACTPVFKPGMPF